MNQDSLLHAIREYAISALYEVSEVMKGEDPYRFFFFMVIGEDCIIPDEMKPPEGQNHLSLVLDKRHVHKGISIGQFGVTFLTGFKGRLVELYFPYEYLHSLEVIGEETYIVTFPHLIELNFSGPKADDEYEAALEKQKEEKKSEKKSHLSVVK